jgi:hypothetical protein
MRLNLNLAPAAVLTLVALPALLCRADELGDKGRDIFKKNQHAVVTVQIVLKMSYSASGRNSTPNESKLDVTGTVVDPSGLTVLALSSCDPAEMYQLMRPDYKVETEVSDAKMLLDDGTEIPAQIVLRDKDLDLAFIRPKAKPASPMAAVDLSKSAPAQILDQVVTLNRLNKAAGRAYAASVERISAVLQKPRTFYIPDTTMSTTTLGSPAFTLNGNMLGVFVMRMVSSTGGTRGDNLTTIILPAEDILKAAKQASEVKSDTEKKEEPKETKEQKDGKEQ